MLKPEQMVDMGIWETSYPANCRGDLPRRRSWASWEKGVKRYNFSKTPKYTWAAYDDVSLVPASGGSNLVANPGFESSGNWSQVTQTGFPGTSFFRSTWGTASPHNGSCGYVISNHPYGYLQSDEILVTENTQYDLYAWMRAELDVEDSAGSWVLRAYFYDENGAPLSYQNVASGGSGTLTTWQQQGGRITTPTDTARLRIQLFNYMNSGWIVFDDISLKQVGVYNLSYDTENRLTGVSGAATAVFTYDGDGNRVKSVEGGVTTAYVGSHFEWKGSTTTMSKYYYIGSTRIAMRSGNKTANLGLTYLLGDHLGSTSVAYSYNLVTGSWDTTRQRYLPWGEVRSGGITLTDYGFTGQLEEMDNLGLMFYVSRFYDSALGRFSQPDTLIPNPGDPASWNRYQYVKNSPLVYRDPSGHAECKPGEPDCPPLEPPQNPPPPPSGLQDLLDDSAVTTTISPPPPTDPGTVEFWTYWLFTHVGIRVQGEVGFNIPIPVLGMTGPGVSFALGTQAVYNRVSEEWGSEVDFTVEPTWGLGGVAGGVTGGPIFGGGASDLSSIVSGDSV